MKYLRAFAAGTIFPGIVFSIVVGLLWFYGRIDFINSFPMFLIPLAWGFTNTIYFAIGKSCPIKKRNTRLFVTGAILGLFVGSAAVYLKAPTILYGWTGPLFYLPMVLAPIVYGFFYMYFMKDINSMVGLKDW